MSWYDTIGSGLGHLIDMWTGTPSGTTGAGANAAMASPVAQGVRNAYDNTDFGKATGLGPFMKLLGIGGPSTPAAPPDTRMATPTELADLAAGRLPPQAGGSDYFTNKVTGGVESKSQNYFGKKNEDGSYSGGFNLPSYQNWDAVGRSYGNRQADIDARDKGVKITGAPEIYQPDLSKIPRTIEGQRADKVGAGHFAEHAYGSHLDWDDTSGWSGKMKFNPGTGKGSTTIYSTGYQAGVEEKEGYRAVAFNDDKTLSASAEAGAVANAGLSGSVGLDTKSGLYATGGIGAKAGLYANADANAKTSPIMIGGQAFDAGIGVHGDTFLGAKAGASGTLGIGPDFIGAKGNIGAFAGAEAAGDIHGNLGPLGAKLGASGMVGAGIGADGDISYKDGKFHIGGKLFAALGYGGSLSGDLTIDFGKIMKAVGPVGAGLMQAAGGGIMGAAQTIGGALHGAYDVGKGVVQGIGDVGGGLIHGIGDVAGGIGHGVSDVVHGIGSGVSDIAHGNVLQGLGNIGGGIVHGVGDVASGIGHGIVDVGSGIVHGVGDVAGGIVHGVGDVASGIGHGIASVGSGIVSGIGSVLSW